VKTATLSDQELLAQAVAGPLRLTQESLVSYQACLSILAERRSQSELEEAYEKVMQYPEKTPMPEPRIGDDVPFRYRHEPPNAFLLTAMRRAQGKPDPLQIKVKVTPIRHESTLGIRWVPEVRVTMTNVDSETTYLSRSGEIDNGRHVRFRVELTDVNRIRVPDATFSSHGGRGVHNSFGTVQSQANVFSNLTLDVRKYVSPPRSGRYQLQVICSEQEIADTPDMDGLIVWRSKPIWVNVRNNLPAGGTRFSLIPLIVLFGIGTLGHWIYENRPWQRGTADKVTPCHRVNSRDVVAMIVVGYMIYIWPSNLQSIYDGIERARPYDEASWKMESIDAAAS
jgi:hypothetical protein